MQRAAKRLKTLHLPIEQYSCRGFAVSLYNRSLESKQVPTPHDELPYIPQRITFLPGVDEAPKATDGPPQRAAPKARDIIARTPENLGKLMGQDEMRYSRTRGKHFLAPELLFRGDRARYFPNISGSTPRKATQHTADLLSDKVSLVAILNSRLSEQHLDSYLSRTSAFARHGQDPNFRHVQIMHTANSAFGPIAWLFYREKLIQGHAITQLFTSTDIRRRRFYEAPEYAHLFLVDPLQRIRWAAIGQADEGAGEIEAMDKCLDTLLQRKAAGLLEW